MAVSQPAGKTPETVQDQRLDAVIGWTLLGGLLLSIGIMALGIVAAVVRHSSAVSHPLPLDQVVPQLGRGNVAAILDLGILGLFATPLAGVIVAFLTFLRQRDLVYVAITAVLLLLLVAGFAVALR